MIIWTVASAAELERDEEPIDPLTACRQAEAADRDSVSLDGAGGQALLVRVGTAPMSVWFEPGYESDEHGEVYRFELRFAGEPVQA